MVKHVFCQRKKVSVNLNMLPLKYEIKTNPRKHVLQKMDTPAFQSNSR